jgi:hypothetical protein
VKEEGTSIFFYSPEHKGAKSPVCESSISLKPRSFNKNKGEQKPDIMDEHNVYSATTVPFEKVEKPGRALSTEGGTLLTDSPVPS